MVYRDFTLAEKIVISFCCVQLMGRNRDIWR